MIPHLKKRCDHKIRGSDTCDDFLPGDLVIFRKHATLIPVVIQPRRIGNGQVVTDYNNWSTDPGKETFSIQNSKEVAMCVDRFNKAITNRYIVVLYQETYWATCVQGLTRKIAYKEE